MKHTYERSQKDTVTKVAVAVGIGLAIFAGYFIRKRIRKDKKTDWKRTTCADCEGMWDTR